MPGQLLQLHQLGNLGVRSPQRIAHDQLRVAGGKFLLEFAHDTANRVFGRGYAKQDLHRAGVILREPTAQTVLGRFIAALERLEHRNGRLG